MRTKKEIREQLINDPLYVTAIHSSTEEDRKKIEGALEPLFVDLISSLEMFIEKVKADPEAQAELTRVLSGDRRVVNSEPSTSGSTG